MKVGTVGTILKCIRARADGNNGLIQIGRYEILALTTAGHMLENDTILNIAKAACMAELELQNNNKPNKTNLVKIDKEGYAAIRNAYKSLEKNYSQEQEFELDEKTGIVTLSQEPLPAELGSIEKLNEWLKSELNPSILSRPHQPEDKRNKA